MLPPDTMQTQRSSRRRAAASARAPAPSATTWAREPSTRTASSTSGSGTTTASATSSSTRSSFARGASAGTITRAGTPASRAAQARPCAMFPALAVTTPFASSFAAAARIAEKAPRSLNEPIGWRHSSLSRIRSSAPRGTRGVRRTSSPIRSRARRISSSGITGRLPSVALLGELGQVGAHRPEPRQQLVLDQACEQLDRRALCPDHVLSDHAADHLHVAEPPDADLLVPVDQRLGKLVQILVLAALRVDLEQRQSSLAA